MDISTFSSIFHLFKYIYIDIDSWVFIQKFLISSGASYLYLIS